MTIRTVYLESAWCRLLIAAAAKGCTLAPELDPWEGECYGWKLDFPNERGIFWIDTNAEPIEQDPVPVPEFDERAARSICEFLGLTEDMLARAI